MRKNRRTGQVTLADVAIGLAAFAAGWLMVWIIFSVPTAGAGDLAVHVDGLHTVDAVICYEDVSGDGPPPPPVCYGADEDATPPAYPDTAVTVRVIAEPPRGWLQQAVHAFRMAVRP